MIKYSPLAIFTNNSEEEIIMRRAVETILSDVDDCLLPTDGGVSPGFFAGLQKVAEYVERANAGNFPPIGWCSGRDRNYIEAVSFFLGLGWWSVIESGIALFNAATKEMLLNPALTLEVQAAFRAIRQERLPGILAEFPELYDYPGNRINIALERPRGARRPIEEYYEIVKARLQDLLDQRLVVVHHSRIAVDISPVGSDGTPIDKASGVLFLAKETGINPSKMLGIGDSRGDFPMLNLVRHVGCPSNASEECKRLIRNRGGYLSPYEYASGVADVIHHFIIERGLG